MGNIDVQDCHEQARATRAQAQEAKDQKAKELLIELATCFEELAAVARLHKLAKN
jgi:hypothetical protein